MVSNNGKLKPCSPKAHLFKMFKEQFNTRKLPVSSTTDGVRRQHVEAILATDAAPAMEQ